MASSLGVLLRHPTAGCLERPGSPGGTAVMEYIGVLSQKIMEYHDISHLSSVKNLQERKLHGDETKLGPRK